MSLKAICWDEAVMERLFLNPKMAAKQPIDVPEIA